jgi:hypothetical protein
MGENVGDFRWSEELGEWLIWVLGDPDFEDELRPITEVYDRNPEFTRIINDIGKDATEKQFLAASRGEYLVVSSDKVEALPRPVSPLPPSQAWPPMKGVVKNDPLTAADESNSGTIDWDTVAKIYNVLGDPNDPSPQKKTYDTSELAIADGPPGWVPVQLANGNWYFPNEPKIDKSLPNNVFETLEEANSFLQPGFTIISTSDGNYTFKEIPPLEERAANLNTMMAELIRDGDIEGALQLDELRDFMDKPRDEGGNDGKLSFDEAFSFASGLAKTTAEFERLFTLATGIDANEVTPFEPFTFPSGFNIADMTEQPVGGFNQFGDVPPSLPGFPQFGATGTPPSGFVTGEDPTEVPTGSPFGGLQTAAHEKPPLIGFGDELPNQVPLGSPFAGIADTETEAAATANNATVSSGPPIVPINEEGAGVFDLSGVSQEDINHYFPSDDAFREEQAGKKAAKGKNPFVLAASNAFELTMTRRQKEARDKRGGFNVTYR